jgi:hypothetical protein
VPNDLNNGLTDIGAINDTRMILVTASKTEEIFITCYYHSPLSADERYIRFIELIE